MTQIEIAESILRNKNDCEGILCNRDNCPFNPGRGLSCGLVNKSELEQTEVIKQWLKEQEKEMIDLTVNQILTEPIKGYGRLSTEIVFEKVILKAIIDGQFIANYYEGEIQKQESQVYVEFSITDPTKPKFKPWLTVEDVPVELWGNALVKSRNADFRHGMSFTPFHVLTFGNKIIKDLVYLQLGQPLTGRWKEFGSEV